MKRKGTIMLATRMHFDGEYWGAKMFRMAFGDRSTLPITDKRTTVTIVSDVHNLETELILMPSNPRVGRSASKHRVFVQCRFCGREIPAGRATQHKCVNALEYEKRRDLDEAWELFTEEHGSSTVDEWAITVFRTWLPSVTCINECDIYQWLELTFDPSYLGWLDKLFPPCE